jgi:hypothetical protein
MIPEPIAPYNSGLVVLFNASLFIIFLFKLLLCDVFSVMSSLIRPQARASGCAPGPRSSPGTPLLTAISSFAATVLHHSRLPPVIYLGALLKQ